MTFLLTICLVSSLFATIMTKKYGDENAKLRMELAEKDSEVLLEGVLVSKEYEAETKKLRDENERLRILLG